VENDVCGIKDRLDIRQVGANDARSELTARERKLQKQQRLLANFHKDLHFYFLLRHEHSDDFSWRKLGL
jgi:hypothetical protein